MKTPSPPRIECTRQHPSLMAADLPAAISYYTTRLGFQPGFTWGEPPTMAGVNLGEVQVFLQHGTPAPAGAALFFVIDDADGLFAYQRDRGVRVIQTPGDRPSGFRDYTVLDPNGYHLTFGHPIYTGGPPVEIERVDVPLRLEKRLAALLDDLAQHKRMTLTQCLEEILLHTCEPLGDGVASPHTRRDLEHIQELKQKHGIDYDSHASYRFVEK